MSPEGPVQPDEAPRSAAAARVRPRRRLLLGLGHVAIVAAWAWVVYAFQPFGHRGWTFAAAFTPLAWLARAPRREISRSIRALLVVELAVWCGLIAWSALSPGGPPTGPKAGPATVRVVSWNILYGADAGPPWGRRGWSVRKRALGAALEDAGPDVLCVQEALAGQLEFLDAVLPRHDRVGVGRDDGRSAGEHCAIYFDAGRFEPLGGGTFWLEEPADEPPDASSLGPKRICTWVRLRDRSGGPTLRVYNTHLYLTEPARIEAVRIILSRVGGGDASDRVLVVGDFNAPPAAPSRRLFRGAGLVSAAELAGAVVGLPTFQFYGIRLPSLDDVYLGGGWRRVRYRVVDAKPENVFPSDHFGILVDLEDAP